MVALSLALHSLFVNIRSNEGTLGKNLLDSCSRRNRVLSEILRVLLSSLLGQSAFQVELLTLLAYVKFFNCSPARNGEPADVLGGIYIDLYCGI